jgi:hypothetical protein
MNAFNEQICANQYLLTLIPLFCAKKPTPQGSWPPITSNSYDC